MWLASYILKEKRADIKYLKQSQMRERNQILETILVKETDRDRATMSTQISFQDEKSRSQRAIVKACSSNLDGWAALVKVDVLDAGVLPATLVYLEGRDDTGALVRDDVVLLAPSLVPVMRAARVAAVEAGGARGRVKIVLAKERLEMREVRNGLAEDDCLGIGGDRRREDRPERLETGVDRPWFRRQHKSRFAYCPNSLGPTTRCHPQ